MGERWVYERELCEVIDRAHPTGKVIAMVTIQDEQQRHRAGGLIAAAPDLLAACEDMAEILGRVRFCGIDERARIIMTECAAIAIAKARGEP